MKQLIISLLSLTLIFDPTIAHSKATFEVPYAGDTVHIDQIKTDSLLESKIREASVIVLTPEGHGSGGYFRVGRHRVVITAAHVTQGLTHVLVQSYDGEFQMGEVLSMPILEKEDISVVLLMDSFRNIDPLKLKTREDIAKPGEDTFYTGYPSTHHLVSFTGQTAGYIFNESDLYLAINTYVWFGSSGSCVFDKHGNLIAIVSAIDVRQFFGPKPHTNLMWGKPVVKHIEKQIRQAVKQKSKIK